jgi:hypothetical protein
MLAGIGHTSYRIPLLIRGSERPRCRHSREPADSRILGLTGHPPYSFPRLQPPHSSRTRKRWFNGRCQSEAVAQEGCCPEAAGQLLSVGRQLILCVNVSNGVYDGLGGPSGGCELIRMPLPPQTYGTAAMMLDSPERGCPCGRPVFPMTNSLLSIVRCY